MQVTNGASQTPAGPLQVGRGGGIFPIQPNKPLKAPAAAMISGGPGLAAKTFEIL
jgi:hypothetical protein